MAFAKSRSDRIVGEVDEFQWLWNGDTEAYMEFHYHLMEVADAYLGPLHFCLLFLFYAISFSIKNNSKPCERYTYLKSQPKRREGLGKTMSSFIAMCNYCWQMEEEADFVLFCKVHK